MKNIFRNSDGEVDAQIVVAAIGAAATLLAALIAGFFGLIQLQTSRSQAPQPTAPPIVTLQVEIEGPDEASLDKQTFFTILSDDAVRAEWTITGFGQGDIDPFDQAGQIYVEPKDSSRIGESFTIAVRVYDENGNDATARHTFILVAGE